MRQNAAMAPSSSATAIAVAPPLPAHRPPLPALTSLRFLTALHVFLFHLEAARIVFAPQWLRSLSSIGYVGVSWFFVLSGFILTYAHAGRAQSLHAFWWARAVRVVPAYWVAALVAAPVFFYVLTRVPPVAGADAMAGMREHPWISTLLAFALLQAWVPWAALAVNPVGWSLSVEAFFYFVFPLMLPWWTRRTRVALCIALALLAAASLAAAGAYVQWTPDGIAHTAYDMNHLVWLNVLRFNPLVRLPEFLIGVCGALLFLQCRSPAHWGTPLVVLGMVAFAAVTISAALWPYPMLHNGLLALPFLAIIAGVACRPDWLKVLEWRGFVALGEVSYSFFLVHAMVIAVWFRPDGATVQTSSAIEALACLAVAVCIALVLYQAVEQPARRLCARGQTRRSAHVP